MDKRKMCDNQFRLLGQLYNDYHKNFRFCFANFSIFLQIFSKFFDFLQWLSPITVPPAPPISVGDVSSSSNVSINVAIQSSHEPDGTMSLNLHHIGHGNHHQSGNFALFDEGNVKEEYPLFHEYRYQPAPVNCHYQQ